MTGVSSSQRLGRSAELLVAKLRQELAELGDPERARKERAYHKSELTFLGAGVPRVRACARALVKEHPEWDREALSSLVEALFASGVHELRSVGIAVLELRSGLLDAEDLPWLISLVRRSPYWAHVDWLATKVIGPVSAAGGKSAPLRAWAKDADFWVRRTALLAQVDALRSGDGDFALFASLAEPMLLEREFFIRKAIGWVLRETAKRRPELTVQFVRTHAAQLSGVSFREAVRHLSPALQAQLTELRAR